MALRYDDRQWLIYDPEVCEHVLEAMTAAALVMFGGWLQQYAATLPADLRDNIGQMGTVVAEVGNARQEINAGLAPNDVPDSLVKAQRMWNVITRWRANPATTRYVDVVEAADQLAGALTYVHQRTHQTGTNHPRWNSLLVAGQPCDKCGR